MEEKPSHGILKEHMIFQKTHTTSLADVRTLNMWGFELSDVSIIERMPNLETISLSLNKINTLRPFSHCYNLKSLFLRQNQISDLQEVNYLQRLPNLRSLLLRDNPISEIPNYRAYIAQALPQLEKLDDIDISPSERQGRVSQPARPHPNPPQRQSQQADPGMMRLPMNRVSQQQRPMQDDRKDMGWEKPHLQMRQMEHRPIQQKMKASSADDSMLAAVLALIPELSDESIQIVLDAIKNRGN